MRATLFLLLLLLLHCYDAGVVAVNSAPASAFGTGRPVDLGSFRCPPTSAAVLNCSGGFASFVDALCVAPLQDSASGHCAKCASDAQGGVAFRCAAVGLVVPSPPLNTSVVHRCAVLGADAICPSGFAMGAACGSLKRPCTEPSLCTDAGAGRVGVSCVRDAGTAEVPDSCAWRPVAFDGAMGCEVGEYSAGLCLSGVPGSCHGSSYGSAILCCANRTARASSDVCAAETTGTGNTPWQYIAEPGAQCPNGTTVAGFCAVWCDPTAVYGRRDNSGMFACQGWRPAQSYGQIVTPCATRVSCPAGFALTAVEQCYDVIVGPGTRGTCSRLSFAAVSSTDCTELAGDDFLWCARDHVATSVCGPNVVGGCPSGKDAELRCCRLHTFHSLGSPCPSGIGYTLLAATAPGPVGFGVAKGFPAIMSAVGAPVGVAACGASHLYVTTAQHALVEVDLAAGVTNSTLGTLGAAGFDKSEWNPDLWSDPATRLRTPRDVSIFPTSLSSVFSATCGGAAVVDAGNHIVRGIPMGLVGSPSPTFLADVVLGAQSTASRTFVNGSSIVTAQLPAVHSVVMRFSDASVFVGVSGAVIRADSNTATDPKAYYFLGDGNPGASVDGSLRWATRISLPVQMAIRQNTILYIADGAAVGGGAILTVNLGTGVVGVLGALPLSIVPSGLALHQAADGRPSLFVASAAAHAVFRVDLATDTYTVFAGATGQPGSVDRAPLLEMRFSSPGRLAANPTHLFVIDAGNQRLVVLPITAVCALGQSLLAAPACSDCADGFSGYPRCRRACDADVDCSSRADIVTGDPAVSCDCQCAPRYGGRTCSACESGRDPAQDCTSCLPGFKGDTCVTFSTSHSDTPSATNSFEESITETNTERVTVSMTKRPTSTKSRSRSPYASSTNTDEQTDTYVRTPTLTRGKSRTKRNTDTASESVTFADTPSPSPSPSPDSTASRSASEPSASPSLVPSPSDSLLETPSPTRSESGTVSDSQEPSPTATRPTTRTASSSFRLIPPRAVVAEGTPIGIGVRRIRSGTDAERTVTLQLNHGAFDTTVVDSALSTCVTIESLSGVTFSLDIQRTTWTATQASRARAPNPLAEASGMDTAALLAVTFLGSRDDNQRAGTALLRIDARCVFGRVAPAHAVTVPLERVPDDPLVPSEVEGPVVVASQGALGAASAGGGLLVGGGASAALAPAAFAAPMASAAFTTARCDWSTAAALGEPPLMLAPFRSLPMPGVEPRALRALCWNAVAAAVLLLFPFAAAHYTAEASAAPPAAPAADGAAAGEGAADLDARGGLAHTLCRWQVPGRPLFLYVALLGLSSSFLAIRVVVHAEDPASIPIAMVLFVCAFVVPVAVPLLLAALGFRQSNNGLRAPRFRRFTILETVAMGRDMSGCWGRQWYPAGCWIGRTTAAWPHGAVACWWAWSRVWWGAVPEVCALLGCSLLLSLAGHVSCEVLNGLFIALHLARAVVWLLVRPHATPGMNLAMTAHCVLLIGASVCGLARAVAPDESDTDEGAHGPAVVIAAQCFVYTAIVVPVAGAVVSWWFIRSAAASSSSDPDGDIVKGRKSYLMAGDPVLTVPLRRDRNGRHLVAGGDDDDSDFDEDISDVEEATTLGFGSSDDGAASRSVSSSSVWGAASPGATARGGGPADKKARRRHNPLPITATRASPMPPGRWRKLLDSSSSDGEVAPRRR